MKNGGGSFQSITKGSDRNHLITFDSHLKTALKVLGVTLPSNHTFNEHTKVKMQEANKCLNVIRCLPMEGYIQQPDVDYVFTSIVLSKLTYALPVYASSVPELPTVQNFLKRCLKRKYISYQLTYIAY